MLELNESFEGISIARNVPLRDYTTLRAGGAAEMMTVARSADELAAASAVAHRNKLRLTILGWGSNMLPSDDGVPGLTIVNLARRIAVAKTGEVLAETGCGFQELWLKTAQSNLSGLEFAVGIPGTLGGALVSNAGAYRSNISAVLTELDIVRNGTREWTSPETMGFSYRDSILRSPTPPALTVIRVRLQLTPGDPKVIYDAARDFQRQRIGKQPPQASAGSFFKNVNDRPFAQSLPGLPQPLKDAGVVPAGFLIEAAGLKGFRIGGAMQGARHANFLLNVGGASAFELRRLALRTKAVVKEQFGVELEEEVLYLGDWSRFTA